MKTHLSALEIRILNHLQDDWQYGHRLWQQLAKSGFASRSSTYEALRRLARLGLIKSQIKTTSIGPNRTYWKSTKKGRFITSSALQHRRTELAGKLRSLVQEYRVLFAELNVIGEETVPYTVHSADAER